MGWQTSAQQGHKLTALRRFCIAHLLRVNLPRWLRCLLLWRVIVVVNPKLQELALLGALACLGLGFAWGRDEGVFAAVFALEAAWAVIEAFDLSKPSV
jgi:hypothetical protein